MPIVIVNGKERDVEPGTSVRDLVESLDLHPEAVAVEYNRKILKRAGYADRLLGDGDQLEIVRFVQGG